MHFGGNIDHRGMGMLMVSLDGCMFSSRAEQWMLPRDEIYQMPT